MENQLNHNYKVDSRYRGLQNAVDDNKGLRFAMNYLRTGEDRKKTPSDNEAVNRFIVSGPGDSIYSFLNAFRAKQ
jgi:hypothetical protein